MKNKNQNDSIEGAGVDKMKINLIKQMIENSERSIQTARELLSQLDPEFANKKESLCFEGGGRIVEGIFDGEKMIGADGKSYSVPQNYASKSKLVEGDSLKLTIADDGSFIYKQIGPVERARTRGHLIINNDNYYVTTDGEDYLRVLKASVTYFKAKSGDEVTVLVPKGKRSSWATIENIISAGSGENTTNDDPWKDSAEDTEEDADNGDIGEDNSMKKKSSAKRKSILDEWLPDLEQIKKEAFTDEKHDLDDVL